MIEPFIVGVAGCIALLVLILSGLHVAIALCLVGIIGMMVLIGPEAAIYTSATLAYQRVSTYTLVIVPLFVMMGVLAQTCGIGRGLYEGLRVWTRRLSGGLGIATVGGCTLFGTVCGSSMVTAVVFAQLSAPEMRRMGYEKKFAYGISISAGMIGMLIPPSVLIVVYGLLTGDSIGRLLIAGISPGLGLFVTYSLLILIMVYFRPSLAPIEKSDAKPTWDERFDAIKSMWGVALMFVIIIGGIFSGIFSPSEAGAVACVLFLIVFIFSHYRSWEGLKTTIYNTVSASAMVFLLMIGAGIFTRFLTLSTMVPWVLSGIVNLNLGPFGFLACIVVLYLILGCFFDSISMISVTLPILHPAALKLGIDPIHFAMVVVLAVKLGLITPPVGLNVYGVKGVAEPDVTLEDLFAGCFLFLLMGIVTLISFILFPSLSTWLPGLMMGKEY